MTASQPKLALITGGVRRVGAHIAARLARAGYALALHGNRDANPDDMLTAVLAEKQSNWAGFTADFSKAGAAGQLLDAVAGKFGRVPDLLVNNASLFDYDDFESIGDEALARHLRINMMVPVLLTTALARQLPTGHRAAVVQLVDQRIRNPNGDQLSYTLAKQGLAASIRTLATACAGQLRVNGVAPGLTIPTDEYGDEQMKSLAAKMPLGELSTPEQIADAVHYLAEATSVTGQILFVDGGANLKSFDRDFVFMDE